MTTKNDITGDKVKTKVNSKDYIDNFDQIFSNRCKQKELKKGNENKDLAKKSRK